MSSAPTIVGAFVLARNGDKQASYVMPNWTATDVELTALGESQAFNLGALLQTRYLARSSPNYLSLVNPDIYIDSQCLIKSDMGSESILTIKSAIAITQGLWPATQSANTTLADGSYVISPLNGYQYVPVQTVDPYYELFLEGSLDCNNFTETSAGLNDYPDWLTMAQENAAFFESLQQYVGGRPTTFANIYNVWDYLNVNSIHNATFQQNLPASVLAEARGLANWYEYNTYSSPDPTSILNINGQTFIPELTNILGRLANQGDSLKFAVYTSSYEPFLSLFAMLGVTSTHPELAAIVNYAGAVAMEVHQPANSTDLTVRFNFKNGTDAADFSPYPMFGHLDGDYDIPLSEFNSALESYGVPDTLSWCNICNNSIDRTCDVAVQASLAAQLMADLLARSEGNSHSGLSASVGGLIGAMVALAMATLLIILLTLFGFISWNRKGTAGGRPASGHHRKSSSLPQIVVRMTKGSKRDSGDSESTRGVVKNSGDFEMMPDLPDNVSVLSHIPDDTRSAMKV